ncbi:endo alpha-1,4 polygalactosaminidase [Actinomadura sp. DC4]|uniref:endo alpha-1,4 polygalactosaminidase n=1 Tax=Actinomadura sp. DC4 TaxID=3055069 RepID=UPI0025AF1A57|nr:endo alpha-1,4 polygalactosaminidase [Actinomadura sp. DC4]MDN3351873.1 endo alpha-1,4 polygalactosaminidase [Actinomadura sp. DC4]
MTRRLAAVVAVLAVTALACRAKPPTAGVPRSPSAVPRSPSVAPPPVNGTFDYQIGAPYPPARGVGVVSRDRSSRPAASLYSICYVNAFQAQPDELGWWKSAHPDLLLRGADGRLVVDEGWDEVLLDVSTPAKRREAAGVVGGWIDGCARAGFQAVEPDNLDSYERSDGRLTRDDNVAFATLLARRAHAGGLAIGQKNAADLLARRTSIGFDFAVTEECGRYGECDDYASAYANRVVDIEYRPGDFTKACRRVGARLSIVLRDLEVTAPGGPHYVFRSC